jgi:hypothetical protein
MAEENEVQDEEELQKGVESDADDDSDDEETEGDERATKSSDEEGEAAASEGESDEDAEARRERNRHWREERKRRRKEKEESFRRELSARDRLIAEQEERLAAIERRTTGADHAALENSIKQSVDAYNHFKHIHATAVEQANGIMATDAAEKMAMARQRFEQLNGIKTQLASRRNAPQPLDPRLVGHAQQWMDKNPWYDPTGKDDDSSIALHVDQRMAAQGWDPTSPEYWEELSARIEKHLPHRAKSGYNKPTGAKGRPPVAGSGRETSSSGSRSTFKLSPERVQVLKDIGAWDDPQLREEHVKNFRDYDKANKLI